jgi:hypothetical protein
MRIRSFIAGLCAVLLAATVQADHEQKTKIKIAISDDGAEEQTFVFDSQDAGFDLQSLQVGEVRSITDRNGTTANVRRTDDGFELDLNGKTIELPVLHEHDGMHGEHKVEVHVDSDDTMKDKRVKKVKIVKSGGPDGVTVISGSAIDDATRARIEEALGAAGHEGEVLYIDDDSHGGMQQAGGKREVRIIKKEVDVTN